MKHFQPNTKYYDDLVISYTATDEFDLRTRVHMTNEKPPFDMFDGAHSMLQNDVWKDFLGYSYINPGFVYNEDTDSAEIFDSNGDNIQASTAKWVNGVRAKNYGPIPRFVFKDGEYTVDYSEEAPRIDLHGILLPEYDLLLHEVYRYLENLYPTHPDWRKLLTPQEFDDEIQSAAAIIDHRVDVDTYNWLAEIILPNSYEAQDQEAAMLKIRDLKSHALIEKWAGSRKYYEMLGSLLYQKVNAYPTLKYTPLEKNEMPEEEHTVEYEWLQSFEDAPTYFENLAVNSNHRLYGRLVRLVDWDASTYDYANRYEDVTAFYCTAYPTPKSRYTLYEYPVARRVDARDETLADLALTMKDDFSAGDRIKLNGQTRDWVEDSYTVAHVARISEENVYIPKISNNKNPQTTFSNRKTTVASIDSPAPVLYSELVVWPSDEKLYNTLFTDNILKWTKAELKDNKEIYKQLVTYKEEMDWLHSKISSKSTIKLCPDPHQDGCFYIEPKLQLGVYGDYPDLERNWPEEKKDTVDQSDILSTKDASFSSVVTGVTKGYVDFDVVAPVSSKLSDLSKLINDNDKIAITVKTEKGVSVLYGQAIYGTPTITMNNLYIPTTLHLDIQAVPYKHVQPSLLKVLYPNYSKVARDYYADLTTADCSDEEYKLTHEKMINSQKAFDLVKTKAEAIINSEYEPVNSVKWVALKEVSEQYISIFEERPAMVDAMAHIHNEMCALDNAVNSINRGSTVEPLSQYLNVCREYLNILQTYWLDRLLLVRCTKWSNPEATEVEKKNAINRLIDINTMLKTWVLNSSNLYDELGQYTLKVLHTKLVKIYRFEANEWNDELKYTELPQLGAGGNLTDWDMGSLNTVSIVESHFESSDWVTKDCAKPDSWDLSKFIVSKTNWLELNPVIYTEVSTTRRYSYADLNFLETFIPSRMHRNVRGEIDSRYSTPVNVTLVKGSNQINFSSSSAITKLGYITTGDQITGKYIPDDTYVKEINLQDHYIVVTNPMSISVDEEIKFTGRTQFNSPDETDEFAFRVALSKDSIAATYSAFEKGNPLPPMSIRTWLRELKDTLRDNDDYRNAFNSLVRASGHSEPGYAMFSNVITVDLDASFVFSVDNTEYLCKTRMLDWLKNESSNRATADVNYGVGITARVKAGDRLKINQFTDAALKLKMITTDAWTSSSIPYYAVIGRGHLDDDFFFEKAVIEEKSGGIENEASYYNDESDPYGIALWQGEREAEAVIEEKVINSIADPLFTLPLCEYEVQKHVTGKDGKYYTAVNFTVEKQHISSVIENNNKTNLITLLDSNRDNEELISSFPPFADDYKYLGNETLKSCVYLGVVYKLPEETTYYDGVVYYKLGAQIIVDGETWYKDDLIIYDQDEKRWYRYDWKYIGVLADDANKLTAILASDNASAKNLYGIVATKQEQLALALMLKTGYTSTKENYNKALPGFLENAGRSLYMATSAYSEFTSVVHKGDYLVLIPFKNSVAVAFVNKTLTLASASN